MLWEPLSPIYLMQMMQVVDTLWILQDEKKDVMITSLEYEKPLDNMDPTNYNTIRLPSDIESTFDSFCCTCHQYYAIT